MNQVLALAELQSEEEFLNSLGDLCATLNGGTNLFGSPGTVLSQSDTMFDNLRWYMISNLRQLLSQVYVEHGIVQTLVDQPVDDAFRAGFEIKTGQLSKDNIKDLQAYLERNRIIDAVMQAIKWARLYGGGAVLIIANQDFTKPFNIKSINEKSQLEFRAVDLWELYNTVLNPTGTPYVGGQYGGDSSQYYNYYGYDIDKSRVLRINGKEAPSFVRARLRGWGMSELERLVRSLNQYLKNQDLIFQLLDEAKVDVYRIDGFNASLANKAGTAAQASRIQMANQMKSFNSALIMDTKDEYQQKQISFTGLSEVLLQIRQGLAADLKMPMTKLFGISAAGFSSGEDDIENYNSMIEGEVRAKNKHIVIEVLNICCQKLFGMVPDEMTIEFAPLRILNAKEEEEVKDSQFNRVMSAYTSGLVPAQEAKQSINKDSLLAMEIDENSDALPPIGSADEFTVGGEASGKAGKQTPAEA